MPPRTHQVAHHLANLVRPHYVFRPLQMVRRVGSDFTAQPQAARFQLPWGSEITCDPRDTVGEALVRRGIFDLLVCEVLLRLADPGESAVDLGANIGHMTSLLAHAAGQGGRIIAFEPHPVVFSRLQDNAAHWTGLPSQPSIELRQAAASDADGVATLSTDVFEINQGSPSLQPPTQHRNPIDEHRVQTLRLDEALGPQTEIGVMKMDIEGHERQALQGAHSLLASGRIRDILFEEREEAPTPVTRLLEEHGYTLIALGERLRGPSAGPVGAGGLRIWDDPSLLATRDPDRAIERLAPRGWAVYGVGPAGRIERERRRMAGDRGPTG